jgi:hypothetical protein
MIDDPVGTDGLIPGTGGSNSIQNGSGSVTGERVRIVGVMRIVEKRRIEEKGNNISSRC